MDGHPTSGRGAPRRWRLGAAAPGSHLAWSPPGGRLSSSYFGTRSVVSVHPGDHRHPAPLGDKEEDRCGLGQDWPAVAEAARPFLLSPAFLCSGDRCRPSPGTPLGRPTSCLPLARARWAAIDRGLTLGVTQGMQPRPSSWALTQVAGLPGVLEPQAPGSSCAHCLGHCPRLPLLTPGSGARACAPASGGPQGVRPAPPRPRAD